MAPIFYHNPYSQHSRKVRMLQSELGFALELKSVDVRPRGFGGENEQPEFLRLNPNGKVPVLQDGDLVLWESNAIACYLAEKNGWSELWPQDVGQRAEIAKWQLWQVAHFSPVVDGLMWEHMKSMLGKGEADVDAVARHQEGLQRWAAVLNGQLEGKDYLVLDRFTLADIAVSSALTHKESSKIDFAAYPYLQKWYDLVIQRPSWKSTALPPMG